MANRFASHSVEEINARKKQTYILVMVIVSNISTLKLLGSCVIQKTKSKPGAKEHHKTNIADMDGLFLYFSNGNGQ